MDSGGGTPSESAAHSPEKKGTSTSTVDMDFISRLPDELLCRIISYVGFRDGVKTSALSHRWQYLSASEPKLQFTLEEMFLTDSNCEFLATCKTPCIIYKDKIVEAINKYLQYNKSEKVQLFKLDFCLDGNIEEDISRWVNFALGKGVESLSLSFQCNRCCYKNDNDSECYHNYTLRKELFDNIEIKLRHLELNFCRLGTDFTSQFRLLNSITFSRVQLPVDDMDIMFSFMVNLETLDISDCLFPEKLVLGSLHLLQRFLVHRAYRLEEIQLSNPNLTELKFSCSDEIKCNLSGAPKLEKLSYSVSMDVFDRIFTDLPEQNAQLTTLNVICLDDWLDWAPPTRVRSLSQVTSLDLQFLLPSEFSIGKAMAILQAFPCLRYFCLMMICPVDIEGETVELSYVPQHLKHMEIAQFFYTPMQMEFAIHLLENACTLEKMSLAITPDSVPYGVTVDQGYHLITRSLQAHDRCNILDVHMHLDIPAF
ncbi:F-box/RNI-like superfamily protein [Euphorbia peplus]|nr:F-box/RNI-like superfamily protein [Euphorbia peplus]